MNQDSVSSLLFFFFYEKIKVRRLAQTGYGISKKYCLETEECNYALGQLGGCTWQPFDNCIYGILAENKANFLYIKDFILRTCFSQFQ